jgi:hypothetical protein
MDDAAQGLKPRPCPAPHPGCFFLTIPITSSTIIPPASLRSDPLIGFAGMVIAFTQEL